MPSEFFDFSPIFVTSRNETSNFKHIINPSKFHSHTQRLAFKSEREHEGIWVQKMNVFSRVIFTWPLNLRYVRILLERNKLLQEFLFLKEHNFQPNKIFITGRSQFIIHLRVLILQNLRALMRTLTATRK